MTDPYKWRIGLTEAELAKSSFAANGIPLPDTADFQDFAVERKKSNGSTAVHGFKSETCFWAEMSPAGLKALKALVDQARSTKLPLFMTVDRGDGTAANNDWIDISGYPAYVNARKAAVGEIQHGISQTDNVTLFLNNVTILNDPSNYTS